MRGSRAGRAVAERPGGPPGGAGSGFPVEVPGFRGPLEQLVATAQRGDIDLAAVPVSEITAGFRARLLEGVDTDPRELADFLSLASRLLSLKASRLLPDGAIVAEEEVADDGSPVDDPGARLAEYRLFRAAAEALLSDAFEQGARSFLSTVCPEVVPSERLAIAPERLLRAFRAVLERLPEIDTLEVGASSFSVEKKTASSAPCSARGGRCASTRSSRRRAAARGGRRVPRPPRAHQPGRGAGRPGRQLRRDHGHRGGGDGGG